MKLADYIAALVAARQQLQILHWQTRVHTHHVALGDAVDGLAGKIDQFVEVACGAAGVHPGSLDLASAIARASKFTAWQSVQAEADTVTALRQRVAGGRAVSAAAAYIVDEMVGVLSRLEYLLSIEAGWDAVKKRK